MAFLRVLEPMARTPGTKFEFETNNSIGNVLNTSKYLNRATSVYKGLVKLAFLGVFEPMARSPGSKFVF